MESNRTHFVKDLPNKRMTVTRTFDGEPEDVWNAWSQRELLDQWWAPRPWHAETQSMDFKVGGSWVYAMVGPDNERHYARIDYITIEKPNHIYCEDYFCDEEGVRNADFPTMFWDVTLQATGMQTKVVVDIAFTEEAHIDQIIQMGFQEGFTSALNNLDEYLREGFRIRRENRSQGPRVTTYLNFPGNTEEAFLFYKSVFGTEFTGRGLQRFGDIPAEPGNPSVPDEVKNMILHVELPILGGHVLMATDAPKEMGFTLNTGNNMHVCLEPASRAETKRLFDALSEGGKVSMPLEDMFFGAYFGECTDRFGINWMFNCFAS